MLSVSLYPPLSTYEWLYQSLLNLVCILWHLTPSQRRISISPVSLSKYLPIVARQRLGKNVSAAVNTHATKEEMLDSISMRFVSYQNKVGD
jgi:hypothetical protein